MQSLPTILEQSKRRLSWETYRFRTELRRRVWDTLEPRGFQAELQDACVFDDGFKPPVSEDDEFATVCSVIKDAEIEQRTYLYHLRKKVFLEPEFGYVIAEPNSIVYRALPGSGWARHLNTMQLFSGVPSWRKLAAAKRGSLPVKKFKQVVPLRFIFENNYYHFIRDLMSNLKIIDEYGIDKSIPLVIAPSVARLKFFQSFCERGNLADRNWLIQDGFYIEADEVVFAKADSGSRIPLDYFLACADAPDADTAYDRRVFLTRDPKSGRNISNMDEILPILENAGFEVVDAGLMNLEEQMRTFSQTRYLIGIHGAGLTNMVYRRNGPLKILEIFPPSETLRCYYELSRLYDFDYRYIRGSYALQKDRFSAFYLDPSLLEAELARL